MDMDQHFTSKGLFRFTLPVIGTMLLVSSYEMVDGFFVSRWVGSEALAAVNFTYPIIMIVGALGFMLGTGGSAVVAKTRGEGDSERAKRQFSLIIYTGLVVGCVCAVLASVLLRPVLGAMGAQGDMLSLCIPYGTILAVGLPATILQAMFQEFFVTAGKPSLGFAASAAAGVTNVVLDAVLIAGLNMGVSGAALATMAGEIVGGVLPLLYFARANSSALKLGRTNLDWRLLRHVCANGSSEMVSNIAMSVVAMAYNVQLLAYLGEAGVAAYGVIAYAGMAVSAVLMGFIFGSSPLMSFQYGAQNTYEMRSLFSRSLRIIAVLGVFSFLLAQALARPLAMLFVGYDASLVDLTVHAARIYSIALLLMGFSMYSSGLFTSLGNGLVSAGISFVRTLVLEVGCVILLPLVFGADGIWWSIIVAEVAAVALSGSLVVAFSSRYGYMRAPFGKGARLSGPASQRKSRGAGHD